ncbi:DUF1634 domain-containing protein [Candidatus Korarchaeum cryptofilum]|jgi:uncharacterized membrane protein|uniref:DUF1634 domain-containing protein n=1 Tax=Korarchaeum cryptofilum (strain OPF8) TaxID=374847 RepID=B1L4X4_KORCO|nr:DUF1634 domain-containing protein [Candidatus Korarchaeum cryptofilum]ACB07503.1 conserved hypothetical protein [Candidatus Korarchaeum cryptofilum OPF8]
MEVERAVYLTLTAGMIMSFSLLSIGILLDLLGVKIYSTFILAGTLILVLTPMVRVVAAIIAFSSSREFYNAAVAIIVLFFMILGILFGFVLRIIPSG